MPAPSPLRSELDLVFDLADRHGIGGDIHLHDRDEKGTRVTRGIIDRTRPLSLRGRVTVSHVCCLPFLAERAPRTMAEDLADLDIALTTVAPNESLVLSVSTPACRGPT
ncbi:hypothetical protein L1I79_17815 [Strepomyces sp. STD 3.1]|uniref:hypothetical protein n=1 Tax=Streptomyces sp. NPDC058985 TaxID=3346684 RepID=UPI001F24AAEA|nr:hypothetical protein [Streptomyces sp. STD 3.1]